MQQVQSDVHRRRRDVSARWADTSYDNFVTPLCLTESVEWHASLECKAQGYKTLSAWGWNGILFIVFLSFTVWFVCLCPVLLTHWVLRVHLYSVLEPNSHNTGWVAIKVKWVSLWWFVSQLVLEVFPFTLQLSVHTTTIINCISICKCILSP